MHCWYTVIRKKYCAILFLSQKLLLSGTLEHDEFLFTVLVQRNALAFLAFPNKAACFPWGQSRSKDENNQKNRGETRGLWHAGLYFKLIFFAFSLFLTRPSTTKNWRRRRRRRRRLLFGKQEQRSESPETISSEMTDMLCLFWDTMWNKLEHKEIW